MAVTPMFPLGTVLLPGGVLPLHVFEPRYRQLVEDCLVAPEPHFGVTLIERGSEVGGGDVRSDVGTLAQMVQVGRTDDGRFGVLSVGLRRIRVREWLPDDPYPIADVEDWPEDLSGTDDSDAWAALVDRVLRRVRRSVAWSVELGDRPADAIVTDAADLGAEDPVLLSHRMVGLAPLGPADHRSLLGEAGPVARLERLEGLLDDVDLLLQFRLAGDGPADQA
jgi:Lon protease-like protein